MSMNYVVRFFQPISFMIGMEIYVRHYWPRLGIETTESAPIFFIKEQILIFLLQS